MLGGPDEGCACWPQNFTAYTTRIATLLCPSDDGPGEAASGVSLPVKPGNYLMISGAGETVDGIQGNGLKAKGVLFTNSWVKLAMIRDGLSNTVAYSESLRGPGSAGRYEVPAGTSNDPDLYLNNAGRGRDCNAPIAQSAIRMGA